ncbi:MAG TPA: sigma 54-interacting transcriptional regulator [Longimicrobium sp.]|nr:sigma 54-interacting transcriptional regulator [Longimicrobium sp.]
MSRPSTRELPGRTGATRRLPSRAGAGETSAACGDEPLRGWDRLVGGSPAIQRVREIGQRVAGVPATVLLLGESGTGKEVVAQAIHESSPRASGPFVAVNCAAIPDDLLEAELFGCEAGAFTGAARARRGWFEAAQGGTMLLDEVAELTPPRQAKLLRVLSERAVRPLGGNHTIALDVRFIAATSCDPRRATREGRLRADLYYRLRVVEIALPPLRERREDVLPLALHFLETLRPTLHHPFHSVSAAALEALEVYPWPGNVRELENAVARSVILAGPGDGDALLPRHLPDEIRLAAGPPEPGPLSPPLHLAAAMRRVRHHYLAEALRVARGNRTQAARLLGISRRALYDLLRELPATPAAPVVPHSLPEV